MDADEEIDSILYIAREVSVYRIPPLNVNEGYRANDWGDLAAPLWKGRLRILENSKGAALQLEDAQTVFAKAEYDVAKPSVEAVLDSSRYFVVRVEDAGKKAYIGLGFAERSDSFDFNVALQDYTKRRKAILNPPSTEDSQSSVPTGPKKDYSLKDGQTFSINIPGRNKSASSGAGGLLSGSSSGSTSSSTSTSAIPLLPPPPSSNRKR
ncbi:hypothetical protein D9619_005490 [Psilocybe cf. subviscida]|uniref:NECAP PHear domain-containing protein n=1 Tax=Psilocybe cf. subviscida TaxID=2480587 RepID=A0A8H5BYQ7_9AGAR|nr:hypothetical protein D9619_005490 [Psilocybe cf. subviscida]